MKISELIERIMKHRHEMAWVVIGQAMGFVGSFVGIKVLTNLMSPKDYGQLAIGLTIAGFLNLYVYAPLSAVVFRYYVVCRERGEMNIYFSLLKTAHKLLAVTLPLLAILAGIVTYFWADSQWALIVVFAVLYGVAGGINLSYQNLQNIVRQRKIVALHQGADVCLRAALAILLIFLIKNSGYAALLGYFLGTLAITLSQSVFALKNLEIRESWNAPMPGGIRQKESAREFFAYAAPFIVFAGFSAVSSYADRWVIQGLFGAQEVGIYAAVYQVAVAPISIFFAMQGQFMMPIIYERAGAMTSASQAASSHQAVRMMVILSSCVTLMMVVFTALFSEPLMRLLTSKVFASHHDILWITTLGLALFNIAQLFSLKGFYYNKPQVYFWPKGVQAVSFCLFAYFLAKRFGIIGVPFALCVSSIVYAATIILVNRRLTIEFSS